MSILREEIRMLRAQRTELQRSLKLANETIERLRLNETRRAKASQRIWDSVRYEVNMVYNNGLSTEDIETVLAADVGEILD